MTRKKYRTIACPICGTQYRVAEGVDKPTCGDPNCVRAARNLGMPFATRSIAPQKATKGKKAAS